MKNWLLACMLILSSTVFAQKSIKGTVTGPAGIPLENVTVTVKGTKTATTTNSSGNYTITVRGNDALLVFSSVGYTQKELSPGNNATLNVSLQLKIEEAEEVVVIG